MPDPAAHVVMLVRNAYTHDSRVEKEARTLVGAGYRVTVVADAAAGLPERERRDGTEVRRVRRRGSDWPGLRYARHERLLARTLVALRPSILHAHDSNALLPVAAAARRLGIEFVYDAHDLWLGRPRRDRSRGYFAISQQLYRLIERRLIPRAAATITVSQPIADHLRRRYGLRRVELVPNYPELAPAPRRFDLHDLDGVDSARPIVLYLGGLMAGRGLEQLIDAMTLVPGAQLVSLGDGALLGTLRQRAAAIGVGDRVHLLRPVPPDEVVAWAASADVGVSPIVPSCLNYRYSLPNKLFQYMAAGIPVVASDFPQVREVVLGSACGLVADATSPAALATAMASVLGDPAALEMGSRGAAAIRERYHWGIASATLLELYAELLPTHLG